MALLTALAWLMGLVQAGLAGWCLAMRSALSDAHRSQQAHASDLAAKQREINRLTERADQAHRDIEQLFYETGKVRRAKT